MSAGQARRSRKRVRTVEREAGWGWIARNPDGSEVIRDFRWSSRSVARAVARDARIIAAQAKGAQV